MRAVVTVTGKDGVGIIAKVTTKLAEKNINILDIRQNVLEDIFSMVMLIDISSCSVDFSELAEIMDKHGIEIGMKIRTMHEKIFDAMHRI